MMTATQTFTTFVKPLAWPKAVAQLTILQRLKKHDKSAIQDCLDAYGGKVWTLARKFTRSSQEAEIVSEAIFEDIWIYATSDHEYEDPQEDRVITKIAIRRLLKHHWEGRYIF